MKVETKQKIKDGAKGGLKIATAASGPLSVAFMFPKETFAFLSMMREAGFELGTIATIAGIAWWLRKDTVRVVDKRWGETNEVIKEFKDDLQKANEITQQQKIESDKRIEMLGKELAKYASHIRFLVTHLQLTIPEDNHDQPKKIEDDPDLTH